MKTHNKLKLLVVLAALAGAAGWAQAPEPADPVAKADLPPAPVIWGNLRSDSKVDLLDLNTLAQNWDKSPTYTPNPTQPVEDAAGQLLGDIQHNWKKSVPGILRALKWDNRNVVFGAAAGGGGTKRAGLPMALGYGVILPTDKVSATTASWPVFTPQEGDIQQAGSEGWGTIEDTPYEDPQGKIHHRYRWPLMETVSDERYTYSFSEEASFKSFDLSLNARYAAFNASLDTSFSNSQYSNSKEHKYIAKLHKDFGWFYVPPDTIKQRFTDTFESDLHSTDLSFALSKYGTHYVYAVHKCSELYVILTIHTTQAMKREEVDAKLRAKISGAIWSVDAQARLRSLTSNSSEFSDISIRMETAGGPAQVNVEGLGTRDLPMSMSITDTSSDNILKFMPKLLQAWSGSANNDAAHALITDVDVRPLSDFIDESPRWPFSRENNLRSWFEWFVKNDGQFRTTANIISQLGTDYRYLVTAPLNDDPPLKGPNGETVASWLQYYTLYRDYYKKWKDDLASKGLILLSDAQEVAFNSDPYIIAWKEFERPRMFAEVPAPLDYSPAHGQPGGLFVWKVVLHGGDFTRSKGYQWSVVSPSGGFQNTLWVDWDYEGDGYVQGYNAATKTTRYQMYGFFSGTEANHATYDAWHTPNVPDAVLVIRDLAVGGSPAPIIFQQCLYQTNCNCVLNP